MSSELLAKQQGYGPICDHCHMLLEYHGDTVTGQMCDLQLAMSDLWRVISIGMFGERRYWARRRFSIALINETTTTTALAEAPVEKEEIES
tara:strand:- start:3615 stop:3887 length:273 start_codon:yes stop_codon:yes gene_type:complete